MRIDTRQCAHCGDQIMRRADERPGAYAKRVFCSVQCLGLAKAARRVERFWSKVDRRGPDECWPWTARRTDRGYGEFNTSERSYRAHRYALATLGIAIPDGGVVMHSCDNPPCCNPAHLKVGTHLDNNRDMVAKGRDRRMCGAANHNTKLSSEDRAALVLRRGEPLGRLAAEFGVSRPTVCRVQRSALCE